VSLAPPPVSPLQRHGRRREREGKEKRKGEGEGSWELRVGDEKKKRRRMANRTHGQIVLEKIKIYWM
jgi:hypothetical protein